MSFDKIKIGQILRNHNGKLFLVVNSFQGKLLLEDEHGSETLYKFTGQFDFAGEDEAARFALGRGGRAAGKKKSNPSDASGRRLAASFHCPYCDTVGKYGNNLHRHLAGKKHPGHKLTDVQAGSIIAEMLRRAPDSNRLSVGEANSIAGINLERIGPGGQKNDEEADSLEPPAEHKVRGLWVGKTQLPLRSMDLLDKLAALVREVRDSKGETLLDLQIRDGYINVYYRGGNLWKIDGLDSGSITFDFNANYTKRNLPSLDKDKTEILKPNADPEAWLSKREWLQEIMDGWFIEHPKAEREAQQRICSKHLDDDASAWVILDMEYHAWLHGAKGNKDGLGRRRCGFDFVAFQRSKPEDLYLVELKLTQGAMRGDSGVESHAIDFSHFLARTRDQKALAAFRKSMRHVLAEKTKLGLMPGVCTEVMLKDERWPRIVRTIFCLDESAAACLGARDGVKTLHGDVERILKDLYTEPLWVDLNFKPIFG